MTDPRPPHAAVNAAPPPAAQSPAAAPGAAAPGAEALAQAARAAAARGPAPVHLWNPPFCGDIDMEIRRDGTWFYQGGPIGRPALARLFASILKREGDHYFLVAPVEKVGIRVEDAPFIAVDCTVEGAGAAQRLTFETNMAEHVTADADHPIRVETGADGAPAPYVLVRSGLEAKIDRKTFYRLAEIVRPGAGANAGWLGLVSAGRFFRVARADQAPEGGA